jgi:hypothetical protein
LVGVYHKIQGSGRGGHGTKALVDF